MMMVLRIILKKYLMFSFSVFKNHEKFDSVEEIKTRFRGPQVENSSQCGIGRGRREI